MKADIAFIALQGFILLFLLLHDWIPLGPFNDVTAIKSQMSIQKNIFNTFANALPIAVALALSASYLGKPYPLAVKIFFILIYALFLFGEYKAWWGPYFFGADPELVRRYQAMFGNTHAFLPVRHGIVPNTAHVMLHLSTLLAFICAIVKFLEPSKELLR
ncbi:MAG: hypothetical protein IMW86_02140 [Hydrogenibacillus sp.]|nr:hypothetical protein [Hydrogenibacillus sp.]